MHSNKDHIDALRAAPDAWTDTAIVVAFEDHFEFVAEDHPYPMNRLTFLQDQGGLAIGLAGIEANRTPPFLAHVFKEYEGQAWAHHYIDTLRSLVRRHN
jgi:hypothetical protein